jgi:hypothetical protein
MRAIGVDPNTQDRIVQEPIVYEIDTMGIALPSLRFVCLAKMSNRRLQAQSVPSSSSRSVKLLHAMIVHFSLADNKTRMLNIEDNHDQKHKSGVEDVQIDLGAQQSSFLSAGILSYAEDASDDDQDTGKVENPEIARPWQSQCHSIVCRRGLHALVEDASNDDEDCEEDDL